MKLVQRIFENKTAKNNFILILVFLTLSLISSSFFLSVKNYDHLDGALRTAYAKDLQTVTLNAVFDDRWTNKYDNGLILFHHDVGESAIFTSGQESRLSNKGAKIYSVLYNGYDPEGVFNSLNGHIERDLNDREILNGYNHYAKKIFTRFVILDKIDEETESNLCVKRATVDSRFPESADEIAITDFQASVFMKFGFIDTYGDGEKHEINSYEDMLGKKLGGLTVVGVYSTEESLDFIKSYDHDYEGDLTGFVRNLTSPAYYLDNFILTWSESYDHSSKTAFLSGDWIENRSERTLLYKLSGNMYKDKKIIKSINYRVKEEDVHMRVIQTYDKRYYAKVESSYTPFYTDVLWVFDRDSGLLTLIVLFTLVTGIIAFMLCRKMFLRLCGFGKRGKNSTINSEDDKAKYKKVCLVQGGIIVLSSTIIALLIALLGFFITNLACNYYWLQLRFITICEVILLAALIVGIPALSCLSKIKKVELQTDSPN